MPRGNLHKYIRKHVHKKLRIRLRMYFFISITLLGVVTYETISSTLSIPFALSGIGIGIVLGIITARMYHISWSHDTKKIVSQFDIFGGAILALYILFAVFRGKIIGHFIYGAIIGDVSISILTGVRIGRLLGTRGRIIQILKEQHIF